MEIRERKGTDAREVKKERKGNWSACACEGSQLEVSSFQLCVMTIERSLVPYR